MNDLLNTLVDAIEDFGDELLDSISSDSTIFEPVLSEINYEPITH